MADRYLYGGLGASPRKTQYEHSTRPFSLPAAGLPLPEPLRRRSPDTPSLEGQLLPLAQGGLPVDPVDVAETTARPAHPAPGAVHGQVVLRVCGRSPLGA